MKYVIADLMDQQGLLVIPTNQQKVHGAGLAKLAKTRRIIDNPQRVYQLDVKAHWRDKVDMSLLRKEMAKLYHYLLDNPVNCWIPLVGLGHGQGDLREIIKLLVRFVEAAPSACIVVPTADILARTPMAKTLTDSTEENLETIIDLLHWEINTVAFP
jgi:hypothetical protein